MEPSERGDSGPREQTEQIEGVRVPCWDAKRRVWQAIEIDLLRHRKTVA